MELSAIVPLPVSVAQNPASAFLALAGQAPLERIVRAMLDAVAGAGRVVVAAAEPLLADVGAALADSGLAAVAVTAADGSGERAACLSSGLKYLEQQNFSTTHVLIGDIRQPLVGAELRDRVIAGLSDAVVVPALPVTDSVKAVDESGSVIATVDRSTLAAAQYPRGVAAGQLASLLSGRTSEDFDEVEEAVRAGVEITVVAGDPDGFRAVLPADAPFFEAVIASRQQDRN
ncbi:IspD/TarI family cytidylyltransferase [Mycolicibacterium holsaticum]|uniref:4-diphosphocytidyl-2C-methyl-D-erythritol kinase n=1 Tax=Mycolicibacterium holsaticum TaxID=152142 RepID=A0A1E3S1D2_9MYCO|nr:2-C-methyl-D-erythritol 4-phosphate cytidylyltransferase [Mycolicibacterium holsaticum]MDA4110595.1 4-diphosphocytidyl-2C-methyl-D-erythritol kinase [Mycolicibacterium holsaticum DSM 44478 = JCM 12374]ODQ95973.1 4-diphosphocytidyl-2C-methyl-D-erythritol kinase [Mycolicibacterium holsaticum]QZA14192.1 2-C-methyl-D-erythritol 4-phosphate cytidylyltransferase [Mycolicibacterium holsaticum DSM 44478 = JCM 12374]UNC08353.1 2-C-methyl-D-erythritol 4-phosphate cytidylyltransferase [Mycolicibacteriu